MEQGSTKVVDLGMQKNLKEKGFNFDWIDVYDPTPEELSAVAKQYQLPEAAVIDCLQAEHLPKFETFENYYFIIVRFYDQSCKPDSDSIQKLTRKIAIFFNDSFILTVHRSKAELIYKVADKYGSDPTLKHPFSLSCKLVKNAFETFEHPLITLDEQIDTIEQRIFLKKRIPDLLKNLYILKRKVHVFKRLNYVSKLVVDNMHLSHRKNSFYEDMRDYHCGSKP